MSWTAIPVAFLAGMVSFLAPCVLPLVPGYLSAVSAVDAERLGEPGTGRRVVVTSVPFVLGFTAFFVLLGVGAVLVGGRLFGWIAAEVGRQPWAVYRLLLTSNSVSVTVSPGMVLFAVILFFIMYAALGIGYVLMDVRFVRKGPDPAREEGVPQ